MVEETPAPDETTPGPTATSGRFYVVSCWPSADRAGKPTIYTAEVGSAGAAEDYAAGKVSLRYGQDAADKWSFSVRRTTKPKGRSNAGNEPTVPD